MAHGLQVFDSSGNIILDTGDRITRVLAIFYITIPANSSAYVIVPNFINDGSSFIYVNESQGHYYVGNSTIKLRNFYNYSVSTSLTHLVY